MLAQGSEAGARPDRGGDEDRAPRVFRRYGVRDRRVGSGTPVQAGFRTRAASVA
jgi:hypothetical protein